MWNSRVNKLLQSTSPAVIVSLFFLSLSLLVQADETKRVKAEDFPLAVSVPSDWEVFPSNPKTEPNEAFFFQSPDGSALESILSFQVHPLSGNWEDLIKKQTHHLLVWEGAPLTVNEPLKLRGAKGHKWIYDGQDKDGKSKIYYRLYLLLPASFGGKRLLLMQGISSQTTEPLQVVSMFNEIANSLTWGLESQKE